MDKLKMQTENIVDENVSFIAQRFPNCVVEAKDENGNISKMVDFDLLKQELSKVVIEGDKERYQMTWPDKKQAILTANSPISKTLRPCKEKSVNFDNTKNIYIEGDNLDVLKVLRETYLGKIKMIYIDPPYNTGNDFVYNDDFATDTDEYLERSNQVDEEGNRMVVNSDSNGRFHTDWLNMIYPRLKVAKDLLADDGVIFISIDDNEQENLKKICNEIFGEDNFVGEHIRKTVTQRAMAKNYNTQHEYCLLFAKNKDYFDLKGDLKDLSNYTNEDNDPNGNWKSSDPTMSGSHNLFVIKNPYTGKVDLPPKGRGWAFNESTFEEYVRDKKIIFKKNYSENERGFIYKAYAKDLGSQYLLLNSLDCCENEYLNQVSTKEGFELFDQKMFDYAKPKKFVQKLISYIKNDKESLILDFFSGSATTAHAVMQLNAEDGGNRKYIMVQLPELTDEKSEAYKAGYKNICDIGEERIRRAGKKIKEDRLTKIDIDKNKLMQRTLLDDGNFDDKYALKVDKPNEDNLDNLDIGFRVFKLDSSNMKDTYYKPSEYNLSLFDELEENIKPDRTPEDLLFQVMLDLGLMLDSKIEEKNINGKKVFIVGEYNEMVKPDLICCFDSNVDNNTVTEIAKMQPRFAVFRDSSMAKDSVVVNFDQIFETYSPSTTRKVL